MVYIFTAKIQNSSRKLERRGTLCEQQEGHFSNRAERIALLYCISSVFTTCWSSYLSLELRAVSEWTAQTEESVLCFGWQILKWQTGGWENKSCFKAKKQHVVTLKRHCTNYTCQNQFTSHREKYCGIRSPPGEKPRWKEYWHGGLCALVSVKTTTEVCNGIFNCRTTKRKTKAINWSLKNSLNILYEVADFHPI